jgi:hypothetical protein
VVIVISRAQRVSLSQLLRVTVSAVASEVAHQLQAAFLDGDFLHPRSNIMKMASGAATGHAHQDVNVVIVISRAQRVSLSQLLRVTVIGNIGASTSGCVS